MDLFSHWVNDEQVISRGHPVRYALCAMHYKVWTMEYVHTSFYPGKLACGGLKILYEVKSAELKSFWPRL